MLKETCLDINVHLEGDIGLVRNVKEERGGGGSKERGILFGWTS